MSKKVSIYEVARYVGVSAAAVSYVINGVNKVSPKTKSRIMQGIEELGYVPSHNAVALSTGRNNLISLFLPLPEPSEAFLENPFYGEFIGGLEQEIANSEFDLIISALNDQDRFEFWARSRGVDGVVIIGFLPEKIKTCLKKLSIPTVLVDVYDDDASSFSNVRINEERGEYEATRHLISQGHRRIAFLGNVATSPIDQRRFSGYQQAMKEASLPFSNDCVFETSTTFEGGYEAGGNIAKHPEITAVCCAADILAIGLMRRYFEMGKSIPKDLSVVGFDDIQAAGYLFPGLTTIRQDIGEKGHLAAKILVDSLSNNAKAHRNVVLEPQLVIRQSVKTL
jgi:LacI family transcriptional regulator